jgi:hypothetical protein
MSVLSYCGGGGVQMVATDGSHAMKLSSVHELFDDKQSYCHTPEGRVWSKAKRHIFDLAGEAVSIRGILDEDSATARDGL